MKIIRLFSFMAAGLALTAGLSSCTSDEPVRGGGDSNQIKVVKAPEFLAYSGNHTWKPGSRAANTNANEWDKTWDCPDVAPLTDAELQELLALFKKKEGTKNNVVLNFENYFVEQVYKGTSQYQPTDINGQTVNTTITGSDYMDKLEVYDPHQEFEYWPANDWVTKEYSHINNFNNGNNTSTPGECGQGHVHKGMTLMTDMPLDNINPENQFAFHESYGTSHDYNNYIIVEYKGYWYVGFDYEMHKEEARNQNEAKDVNRDWNFTDWIVRIIPGYHAGQTPEYSYRTLEADGTRQVYPGDSNLGNPPGDNNNGDNNGDDNGDKVDECPVCGHPTHDGDCDQCDEGTECHPSTGTPEPEPEQPEQPGVSAGQNEVEVNLNLEDRNSSHLSIHVRHATNVEIFIPVPEEYFCDPDDMEIVVNRPGEAVVHGGPFTTVYDVNGHEVTLNVEYVTGGIRIWTTGINEEVIEYCQEAYGDGITFEVWNYYNDTISREDLKYLLNRATVKFLDSLPDSYINAFNEVGGSKNPDDCTVTIVSEQSGEFYYGKEGEHYNGSHYNMIYDNKNPSGDSK